MENLTTFKRVVAIAVVSLIGSIVIMPCILTFTEGMNGEPTIWNLIGMAYTGMLILIARWLWNRY